MSFTKDFSGGVLAVSNADGHVILTQPFWPDGTAWNNEAEALAWGDTFIAVQDGTAAELPGPNPSTPTEPFSEPDPEISVEDPLAITEEPTA